MSFRIAVMGAGALGSYFGGCLARSGVNVTLIGRAPHIEAIRRDGLLLESGGAKQAIPLEATTEPDGVRAARLVLFCVKSADTERAAPAIAPHLSADAVVLSLQNGVGNVERIRRHVKNPVAAAVVYTAATLAAPGHVRHTGGGSLIIGAAADWGVTETMLSDIAAALRAADIPIELSRSIEVDLWTKLMQNCAYNAVCALTGKPYGEMVAMPEMRAVMHQAGAEVVALAQAKGISLGEGAVEAALNRASTMATTMSSTAQDLARGRPTEINYLNGYVAREGDALGVVAPINRALYALVKLREK
jgi:2-dehydropantoate 2-reductase